MYRDSETGIVFHKGFFARSMIAMRLVQLFTLIFKLAYVLFVARFAIEYLQVKLVGQLQIAAQYMDRVIQPFRDFVTIGRDRAGHPLDWAILLALVACAVVHLWIVGALRLIARAPAPEN